MFDKLNLIKRFNIVFILFFCVGLTAFAQNTGRSTTTRETSNTGGDLTTDAIEANRNIMLARSSADYRVTPGDIYTLFYLAGNVPVTYIISVDTSYRIRVSNLGIVNGSEKTFTQVRSEVEAIVIRNFPFSGVQLVLTQPAMFNVFVNGEVQRAEEVSAWGLSRLSSLINENLNDFASIRDITIRSSNEQVQIYDLFKAQRFGDISQDPFLRPGDVITFNRIDRRITINGEVERPGSYQLLKQEKLTDLINIYANGFTPLADPTRMELVRLINSENVAGDRMFLSINDLEDNFPLEHFDTIYVPSVIQLQPVLFVEGAIITGIADAAENVTTSNRLIVRFLTGETYASLVRRNAHWFSEISDTQNAYVQRNNERIPINLNLALFDATYRGIIMIQDDDILVIPFRQYFVTVAGAVRNPGRYPYIPDRDWEYYIGLAGGFIQSQNAWDSLNIVDLNGNRLRKSNYITPETTITAKSNHFLYRLNQITPVLTVVSTIISIILITR
ncbi:MAG: SLBB domain-containing protein [Treponema sp.]|jgi:protein involved in polysaccharide export with SLBB domain|nr:SLBB domain-containing protein [Treponema sp.]